NRDVMNIFIFESAIMGLIGGVLGVIAGMGASYLLAAIIPHFLKFGNGNSFFLGYVAPVFSIKVIVIVIIASLLIGILAGAAPAYKAAKVDPIKVLRNE
ncbi:MAG: FtsX-like permease family protein, partial [Nitrososphaeria archaeon]